MLEKLLLSVTVTLSLYLAVEDNIFTTNSASVTERSEISELTQNQRL